MSKAKTTLKNSSFELIQNFARNLPAVYAFIDNQKKITSFNDEFKDSIKEKRIKGRKIADIFSVDESKLESLNENDSPITISDKKNSDYFFIYPNYLNHKKIGYSVTKAINLPINESANVSAKSYEKHLFQKEWENILSQLIQDISLEDLTDEILKRCYELTDFSWGIVIFNEEASRQQTGFRLFE